MERLNIDFKGPQLHKTNIFSRFPFVFPCPNISSQTVIKCLNQLFRLCGTSLPSWLSAPGPVMLRRFDSQGLDKLNIRYLKHIGPLGLTSMFKTALNKNEYLTHGSWLTLSLSQNPTKTQTRVPHTGPYPSSQ